MAKTTKSSLLRTACSLFLVLVMLPGSFGRAKAGTRPLPEPYTHLYVIYESGDERAISIEITNQVRLPGDRGISATLAVRAESLIAYDLTFQQHKTSGQQLEELEFLPIYPGRTYQIGSLIIEPGGYLTINAWKFGATEDRLWKTTTVQLAILVLHLVGASPPTNLRETIQAAADSAAIIPGGFGLAASSLSLILEAFSEEPNLLQALEKLGDAVLNIATDVSGFWDDLASFSNSILKQDRITGTDVEAGWNTIKLGLNIPRVHEAINELREYPPLTSAVIVAAPLVTQSAERYRVLQLNEPYKVSVEFQNASGRVWSPSDGYELLILANGWPVLREQLVRSVGGDAHARWDLNQKAPAVPGIYHISYQMALKGKPIGPVVPGEIVVIPERSPSLRDYLETLIEDTRRRAVKEFDEYTADLERRIGEAIAKEITQRLRELCGGTLGIVLAVGSVAWSATHRRKTHVR